MKRIAVLTAIAGLALGGCASDNVAMHMSSYDEGFKAGCESGIWYDLTEIKDKDYNRAMNDRGYFHGWDEGFSECRYNVYRHEQHS